MCPLQLRFALAGLCILSQSALLVAQANESLTTEQQRLVMTSAWQNHNEPLYDSFSVAEFWQSFDGQLMLPELSHSAEVANIADVFLNDPNRNAVVNRLQHLNRLSDEDWPELAFVANHRLHSRHSQISLIKQRLVLLGDLAQQDELNDLYDDALLSALKGFQQRHGLVSDGVIGHQTLAQLNRSPNERRKRLARDYLSRIYLQAHLPANYVLVNIADYSIALSLEGEIKFQGKTVVGKPQRPTPLMQTSIKSLIYNPTWTVPGKLVSRDILPKAMQDNRYLEQQGFQIRDAKGNLLESSAIDWTDVTDLDLPLRFTQQPGPNNALGKVKFFLNNERAIYLHDTPNQHHFKHPQRAYSSGCVRVENAQQLASIIGASDFVNAAEYSEVHHSDKANHWLALSTPLPLYTVYLTSSVERGSLPRFQPDIYNFYTN
ncbi:L,D-transpeptidase family protein [Paraferrimonas haliotis]|uniref:L,D-transpeptidase family protein n=1 Tax=Paraferrimonas haliotis TaxID=2013866 RepID=UPI000BA9CE25|nr:L,D-transpeptidase family protein [Paraferrimonas haliotis]